MIGPDDLARRAETRAAAFAAGLPPAQILGDGYVELLELGGAAFSDAFRRIVEPGGVPALVHCAIGKDRTGVLVALLLDAAGVDHDEIVADYARSGERMAPIIERWMTNNPSSTMSEQIAAFTAMAPAETMAQVLDHLDDALGRRGRLPRRPRRVRPPRWRRGARSSSPRLSVASRAIGSLAGRSSTRAAARMIAVPTALQPLHALFDGAHVGIWGFRAEGVAALRFLRHFAPGRDHDRRRRRARPAVGGGRPARRPADRRALRRRRARRPSWRAATWSSGPPA